MDQRGKVMKLLQDLYSKAKGTQLAQLPGQGRQGERTIGAKDTCPGEHREDAQMATKENIGSSGFP